MHVSRVNEFERALLPWVITSLANKNKQNTRRSVLKNKQTTGGMSLTHPPQFNSTFVVGKKLRFKATTAGTYTVTWTDLGDLFCVASAANAAYQVARAIRIKSLEIWAPMASDLIPVTCSVEWFQPGIGVNGNSVIHSDTSMGSSTPAHVKCKAPKSTLEGFWQSATLADNAFRIVVPANAVIDFSYAISIRDDGTAQPVTAAVAGATTGANYIRALNSSVSTTILAPVSYATV